MAILIYTVHHAAGGAPSGGGAAITISDIAARELRALATSHNNQLDARALPLLDRLADGAAGDSDLRLVISAIVRHGVVDVRWV